MSVIARILLGLIAGALARMVLLGRGAGGFIVTNLRGLSAPSSAA